jgi:hypothetical protein
MTVRVVALVALLAIAPFADAGGQQRSGTARVRGTVVAADTGTPVRRATVRLRGEPAGPNWVAVTDASGRFDVGGLPAGRFIVEAMKPGFVAMSAGQKSPSDPARRIEVREGQTYDGADIRLPRGAVITGRLLDEFGEPVVEAQVRAFRTQYMQGVRRLVSVRDAQTNDVGQFRIYGLPAGKYYVSATLRVSGGGPIEMVPRDVQVVRGGGGFAPTFFPGTVSAADAQAVVVEGGSEAAGVDFSLLPDRLAGISGSIVESHGKPAPDYLVMVNAARPDRALLTNTSMAETGPDGRFTLSNIAPGEYRLDVRAKSEIEAIAKTGGVGQPQRPDAAEFASVPITVSGDDIEGLTITTTRGYRMTGRVVVEGADARPELLRSIGLTAAEITSAIGMSAVMLGAHTSVQADGSFELRGLSGTRIIRLFKLPGGWTLKSARAGGIDVTDDGIQIVDDVTGVEVVIGTRPTRIAGTVTDAKGVLAPNGAVIVFPEDRQRRTAPMNRFVTSTRAGADGTFKIEALPPGNYLAVAVDTLVDGDWADPENLEQLAARATKFSLGEGELRTLTLRLP